MPLVNPDTMVTETQGTIPTLLDKPERRLLLAVARESILRGLESGHALGVDLATYPPTLINSGASFVTLHRAGQLRGCIGHLTAIQPLAADVAENAFSAAFRDTRFAPLKAEEMAELTLKVSVLSKPELMQVENEADLLAQLQPGTDGLILDLGGRRGTFLPSVWEQLPEPVDFLRHLKRKAGLTSDFWSPELHILRYRTECFGD